MDTSAKISIRNECTEVNFKNINSTMQLQKQAILFNMHRQHGNSHPFQYDYSAIAQTSFISILVRLDEKFPFNNIFSFRAPECRFRRLSILVTKDYPQD